MPDRGDGEEAPGAASSSSAAPGDPAQRTGNAHTSDSRMLAQRSPAASVKSEHQLQRTVLRVESRRRRRKNADDDDASADSREGAATSARRRDDEPQKASADHSDDDDSDVDVPLTRVEIGSAWDESDEDEDDPADMAPRNGQPSRPKLGQRNSSTRSRRRTGNGSTDYSYSSSLRPWTWHIRQWLVKLTRNQSSQSTLLSPYAVAANLLSASLNPAVLLSMPAYFDRTGTTPGIVGLVVVATLAGAGGGLWVVLGRYVGGSNIEAITAASCGRNTRWKSNAGRAVAGILLACYGTGTAVIAYFALADLLLQVFFHYASRGIFLHDRLFVTIVVGALVTTPLIVYPLAKRNLIRFSTLLATVCYPAVLGILLYYIYNEDKSATPREPASMPSLNPLYPPSIWAPYSLLPLLSLSASPLQIIAHNRSLRRTGISGSNVKSFLLAQLAQTIAAVGIAVAFGIGVGTQGMGRHLGLDLRPNLFTTLPLTDNLNLARILFVAVLSSHLALCLVTVRSAWARLLHLFYLNPFRGRDRKRGDGTASQNASNPASDVENAGASNTTLQHSSSRRRAHTWTRPARNALAGLLLWALTAFTAYWSGVGGFHRRKGDKSGSHPNDEAVEANFTRAQEVLGLLGAGVGFVLPALVWIILFHVRQPRAILPPFASDMAKQASAWFLGPQSVLALRKRLGSIGRGGQSNARAEREPLLAASDEDRDAQQNDLPTTADYRASLETAQHTNEDASEAVLPTLRNGTKHVVSPDQNTSSRLSLHSHQSGNETDEATRILLARKERQLQNRSRGRRRYQDLIVLAGILPLGVSLIVLGALDLKHGGW